jgi:LytS/YehU family sensor histidine kinase
MLVHSFVENAVKHGLVPKETAPCNLNIIINQTNNTTMILIKDNGIGRKASQKLQLDRPSTGKGIEISEQLILFYNKLHKSKVSQSFKDIVHENGQPAGTEVVIFIQS